MELRSLVRWVVVSVGLAGAVGVLPVVESARAADAVPSSFALGGYCPVAYVAVNKALKGDPRFAVTHGGQTFLFVNADAKAAFEADPTRFDVRYTAERLAVRFQYEWHDRSGAWFRSYGNELWTFAADGRMARREASINDVPIAEEDRRFRWTAPGRRPDAHPGIPDPW